MAKSTGSIKVNDDWEVEDALRTITRAEEIKKDAKLMAKVKALAKKKLADMKAAVASAEMEA